MTNREIDSKVAHAFENIVPDIQEKILERCFEENTNVVPLVPTKKVRNRKIKTYAAYVAGIAAGLMLMIGGLSGVKMYRANYIVDTTVSLDVNPSIEIKVNQKAVVLEVVPRNEDAEIIVGEMDFEGSSLEITLNALVGSMLKNGYLNEIANSILVSIDGGDDEHSLELQAKIAEDIENTLLAQEFNAAVLCQTIKPTDELKELAEAHNVSVGKAQLIQEIANQSDHTFEDLASLSINELSLLTESDEVTVENLSSTGTSSKEAYIAENLAIEAAKKAAGLDVTADVELKEFECELEYENGVMVYEIEFIYNEMQHEYDIDATTGELVNSEVKPVEKPAPTAAPEPTVTNTPTPAPTATNTPTPVPTATNTPTPEPTATNTPTPVPTATNTPSPEPTATPTTKPGKDPKPTKAPHNPEDVTLLTEEQVKEIVLGHLAIAADLMDDFEIRLVNNNNNKFFMVKFEVADTDYTLKIDAVTGEITSEETEPDEEDDKDKENKEDKDKEKHPILPGWNFEHSFPSTEKMKEMILAHAALTADVVDDFEIRFVANKNNVFFLIKFEANDTDYSYKIDAFTGEILASGSDEEEEETEEEAEKEDKNPWGNWEDWMNWDGWQDIKPEDWTNPENWPQFPDLKPGNKPDKENDDDDAEALLTSEQVKELVLADATLTADVLKEYEEKLTNNKNNKFYQITFETETAEYTYKVNAITGEIISSEVENDTEEGDKDDEKEHPWGDWEDWNDWFDREYDDENEGIESEDDEDEEDDRWEDWFDWMNPNKNNGNKDNGNKKN